MPKPTKGPRLGGSAAHQRHIIANLCKDLIRNKSVRTTQARAKAVQPYMEKLITKAKRGDTANRRQALKVLGDRELAYILFEELAPLFAERDGGYTRITKIGNRKGDNAPMAVISLVTEKVSPKQAVVQEAEKAAAKAAAAEESAEEVEESESAESAESAESSESAELADDAEATDDAEK
ncbi:50S ribosomal protein L17 [Actinobaculum sp. 313]|uniref:50S ribosomal protein L17 n=1 Tax=Actinobaculum sp. 313 TaxID=2495645 RepID=UPI000D527518|nr:50S ribosomal protein L17 [Actinobaculum sp. 313]AWE42023.1 50S ribosomal protein L17 [Actinobaculum sp. 313]